MSISSSAHIGVHVGGLVFVLVDDRAAFDAIPVHVLEGKCLSKSVNQGGLTIIFQYWEA